MEPLRDGTMKESRRAIPVEGAQFVCRGPWIATAGQAYNFSSAVTELLPGGYAITEGCPKDVWDGWHMQNKTSDLVKNQVVLAHKDRATLITECKQLTSVVTGLEPLDRNNPSAKMGGVDRRLRLGILEQGEGNR
jgi:hypothetical protein